MQLKNGDTVRLKSGGPLMTVDYSREERVGCIWFNKYDDLHRHEFPIDLLEFDKDQVMISPF